MKSDNNLTPQEQELFDALKAGAVILVDQITGEHKVAAHDDLPPDMRACIRVSRALKQIPYKADLPGVYDTSTPQARAIMDEYVERRSSCPDCIEAAADSTLMDAESRREEGNEVIAAELEADAAGLRLKAARIRTAGESR
jgi:hypothetical protein